MKCSSFTDRVGSPCSRYAPYGSILCEMHQRKKPSSWIGIRQREKERLGGFTLPKDRALDEGSIVNAGREARASDNGIPEGLWNEQGSDPELTLEWVARDVHALQRLNAERHTIEVPRGMRAEMEIDFFANHKGDSGRGGHGLRENATIAR